MSLRRERKHSNNNSRPINRRPVKAVGMNSRLRKAYVAAKLYDVADVGRGRAIAKRRRPAHPDVCRMLLAAASQKCHTPGPKASALDYVDEDVLRRSFKVFSNLQNRRPNDPKLRLIVDSAMPILPQHPSATNTPTLHHSNTPSLLLPRRCLGFRNLLLRDTFRAYLTA